MPLLQVVRGNWADSVLRGEPAGFVLEPFRAERGLRDAEEKTEHGHALVGVEREVGDRSVSVGEDLAERDGAVRPVSHQYGNPRFVDEVVGVFVVHGSPVVFIVEEEVGVVGIARIAR